MSRTLPEESVASLDSYALSGKASEAFSNVFANSHNFQLTNEKPSLKFIILSQTITPMLKKNLQINNKTRTYQQEIPKICKAQWGWLIYRVNQEAKEYTKRV